MGIIEWALIAGIAIGIIGIILIVLTASFKDENDKTIAAICAIALLVMVSPMVMFDIGTSQGQAEYQGTPTDHLPIGKEYNVLAINITEKNAYITLKGVTDGKILLYDRPLSDGLPKNLSIGDTITLIKGNQLIITIDIYCS